VSDKTRICNFAGHEWSDAGGGFEICTECQAERWAERALPVKSARSGRLLSNGKERAMG
jgi:hypothetical protein